MLLKWAISDTSATCGKIYLSTIAKEITEYSIPSLGIAGIIKGNQIVITSESIVSISSYVANFKTNGVSVSVNGVPQTSGVTSNSYLSPLTYIVTGADGSTNEYTIQMVAPRVLGGGSLRLWFKADQLTLNDGDPIATWSDVSGYGNHIAQPNASLRPVFKKNQINGYPIAEYRSATASRMDLTSGAVGLYVTNSGSVFFVMRLIDTIAGGITLLNLHGGQGREISINHPISQYLVCRNGASCATISALPIPKAEFLTVGSVQVLMSTAREYWNGNLKAQVPLSYDYSGGSIPNSLYLGNGNLDADLVEVLYFNTDLSDADVQKVFFYLNTKYALLPM
ncbi:DUF5018 domain-containing protein [Leptospira terpstrae]|uniref:Concanavalin A-like lectin/glucanases family protein n=1 Tax=Leptospira terpstrae serovar Hualin str. LT 11-33 = ATCC 700639 TaxID=1257025 RepID=N1VL57_9LEPT|nr:hypothetical protein [Leptospira terpstrae]EMY60439.1 hypothetical protein LEP1GSC203_2504 [Leptospira terpstrae serovar Hualin str. LT 11-33 = ATCC 700639]